MHTSRYMITQHHKRENGDRTQAGLIRTLKFGRNQTALFRATRIRNVNDM
jgi:hypothetical protein